MQMINFTDAIASVLAILICICCSVPEKLNKFLIFAMLSISLLTEGLVLCFPNTILSNYGSIYIYIPICIILLAIFTKNKIINVLSAVFAYIIIVVFNNILLLFLDIVLGITVEMLLSSLPAYISFTVVYLTLSFLICKLLKHLIVKLDIEFMKKYKVLGLLLAEITICAIILIFNISYGRSIDYPSETIYFNCVLFVMYFLLSLTLVQKIIASYKKAFIAEEKERHYKELEEYMRIVDENIKQTEKFKHDYMNILFTMETYINNRELDKLKEYYNTNIKQTKYQWETDDEKLYPLSNIDDMPIRSLLLSKFNYAISKNIDIYTAVEEKFVFPCLAPVDTARILGILVDNAIEATLETKTPQIAFVCGHYDNNNLDLAITNTFNPENKISVEKIFEKGFSTKGENRGTGLDTVKELLSRYDNVYSSVTINENIFTFTISFRK